MAHRKPIGTRQDGGGDEESVEDGEGQSNALPSPIATGGDGAEHDDQRRAHGDAGANAEKSQAGADADEFGDQREEIAQHQITHGEEAPEFTEAVEDEFGVAAMSDGAETHGHFLHDEADQEREHNEGKEEADAETRAGGGIGKHAGRVIFAEEDQYAGSDEEPQQAEASEESGAAPLAARAGDLPAVAGAIHILVRQEMSQIFRGGRCGGRLRGGMRVLISGIGCRERDP